MRTFGEFMLHSPAKQYLDVVVGKHFSDYHCLTFENGLLYIVFCFRSFFRSFILGAFHFFIHSLYQIIGYTDLFDLHT